MDRHKFPIRVLPTYEADLEAAACYIRDVLNNRTAAEKLVQEVEQAIHKRAEHPFLVKPYLSRKKRKNAYYPIYVGNYIVFYVVLDNVMEVRRLIYSKRDIERIL